MKMRWLAAGIAAVLITGGAATVAQRVITQKTRGVLPETNDAAHPDARRPELVPQVGTREGQVAARVATQPDKQAATTKDAPVHLPAPQPPWTATEPILLADEIPPPIAQPVVPTVAISATPGDAQPLAPIEPPRTSAADGPPSDTSIVAGQPTTDAEAKPASASSATPNPLPRDVPAVVDPVDSVESFVERNRKEAEGSIKTLTTEAENLKARLIRVEAALVRWQSFSRALSADQPDSQTIVTADGKTLRKLPNPEQPPSTPGEGKIEKPEEPAPDLAPLAHPPEASTTSAVGSPSTPATPPPGEPVPMTAAPIEPPGLPRDPKG